MNALIDLNQCREFMTVNINGKDHPIKLAGTIKQPYFCGKDICEILDHKDSKYALKTHVPPKYKKELTYFYGQKNVDLRGGNPPPQNMVICSHNILGKDKITFREGQTIYVSEPGLYALIMNSKTMFASIFQLSNITSANKKDIWNQIKELTGWISSKREIGEGSFKYKITY